MPRSSSNPLTEQKQRLAAEQARIARELAAMEKLARQKPKPERIKLEPARRLRVETVQGRVLPPRPRDHIFPTGRTRTPRKKFRRRKTEAREAQMKFLVLCVILIGLLLFFWKNLF